MKLQQSLKVCLELLKEGNAEDGLTVNGMGTTNVNAEDSGANLVGL
jgi:hypothetical protein